jgi:hypothetical protein
MTTSQTYQTDDDQLARAHDQAIPEDNPTEQDADLAESGPDPMAPNSYQTGNDDSGSHPAGAATLADGEPAASMASDYPGFTPDGDIPDGEDQAAEPEMADGSHRTLSLVSGAFTVPEAVTGSRPAGDTAHAAGPWNEVKAMFVDDPHASVERAAGLVNDRVEELIRSVRDRQSSMQSAWQADDAGTEELRVALQHYRTFWNSLEDLPAPA